MIQEKVKKQREYFHTGKTVDVEYRIKMLKKLYDSIQNHEQDILKALEKDLGKNDFEAYMCEIGLALSEITHMIKHVRSYAKEKTVKTPLGQFPARSYMKAVPYGTVLIMSPWNYPFLLTIDPLANAIAAGNTAIVKPSAYSPCTSEVVRQILEECFDEEVVCVITGGRKENAELLKQKFDFIFFTGSTNVGKEVLRNAAEHLTPAVLELGGKSPCIVDKTAKIELAAKRIVFGKYLNCGQTCVAPDYLLVHSSVKDQLIKELKKQIELQYTKEPLNQTDYGKIINEKHFERVKGLIDVDKVVHGGKANDQTCQIEPTVMDNVTWDDAVMKEEIFGPILPVLTYETTEEIIHLMQDKPKPLALYLFTEDKQIIKSITERIQYGGGCINDVVVHLGTSELAFGGVGESGMGNYHGKAGFDAFSHTKNIMDKKTWMDMPVRYRHHRNELFNKLLRMFFK